MDEVPQDQADEKLADGTVEESNTDEHQDVESAKEDLDATSDDAEDNVPSPVV